MSNESDSFEPSPVRRENKSRISRHRLWLTTVLLVFAGGFLLWQRGSGAPAGNSPPSPGGAKKGDRKKGEKGGGPVPVVAARARKGNIGVYFPGLGSVTPLNTVTVRSRVDGQLIKVHYREGDIVR